MTTLALPAPSLAEGCFASLTVFTDEALFDQTGIRIAFTTRMGGVSVHPYESLNVGNHVNDDDSIRGHHDTALYGRLRNEDDKYLSRSHNPVHGIGIRRVPDEAVPADVPLRVS